MSEFGKIKQMLFAGLLLNLSFVSLPSFAQAIQVFMAGDSTMSIKGPKDYPETGWGMPFSTFFNEQTKVVNLAKNGRSTKTFISEGLWQQIESNLQAGDYLFIQFGHNDQSESKIDRYTSPEQYVNNIQMMLAVAKSKQASVVLMTPISRRHFNEKGELKWTHPYADLVRNIAQNDPSITFIDMEKLTHDYIVSLGEQDSALRFMHIKPDLHPNYPNGVKDNTHLNQLGAREVAQIVLSQLKVQKHPLLQHVKSAEPKHLQLKY